MKKHRLLIVFALLWLTVSPGLLKAQTTVQRPTVKVSGEVTTPLDLNHEDLLRFKQTEVTRKAKDGKSHTYTGVILSTILKKAGVTLGKELRGKNLTKYLLINASDGYEVVFALAELDEDFTDRVIILADKVDGKPLPAGEGPFRVVVQDEKKPARCIREVIGIKVLFAK